jgi:hypothetical protein
MILAGKWHHGARGEYRLFTKHEDFQIVQAAARGATARQIGEKLGRKPRAVERRGRRLGVRFKNYYTEQDVAMLRDCLRRNWTLAQIAVHFQRDVGSVRNLAIRHRISIRPKKKINRVSIRIHGDLLRRIEAIAGPSGEAVGRYVRKVLRDAVASAAQAAPGRGAV